MYKFFVENEQVNDKIVKIIGQDVNHIKNVLRLQVNDNICICNKQNSVSYNCCIKSFENNFIICQIINKVDDTTETKTYIHIFQGLPKADKMEYIIEKCTEIGVKEVTPVIMKRTIVKLDPKDKLKKIDRWKKIAEVAAKQSKRDTILNVNSITDFKDIFENIKEYDIVLVAYENEQNNKLKPILQQLKKEKKSKKVAIIIGPEGGIDKSEIEFCKSNNAIMVSLGKRILRTETAPLVISSNILYELEE